MKSLKNIAVLFPVLFYCHALSAQPTPVVDSMLYKNCCGAEPVEFTYEDAYVFVPNVFTPNKDSVNDLFHPFVNEGIVEIIDFLIYTAEGDTLLFDRPTFDFSNLENYGWNGLRYDGRDYIGGFRYTMLAALRAGGLMKIEGKGCRIACGPDAAVFEGRVGCFYPSQVDVSGHLDETKPNLENGCF